ncbi:MAG: DUF2062 domain-containing protein [Bacteroidales bacterium]
MKRMGKRVFKKLIAIEDPPRKIIRGFAMGSFIGMMPIPGAQMFVALTLSFVFGLNKKAACIAVFNTNILTGAFVFAFNFWLGKQILGLRINFEFPSRLGLSFIKSLFNVGSEVFLSMFVGGIVTGILAYGISFYLLKVFFNHMEKK